MIQQNGTVLAEKDEHLAEYKLKVQDLIQKNKTVLAGKD